MMKFRYLETSDYPMLCKWWSDNRFPIPPQEFLPRNGTDGILITKDGVPLCAGFIYETSSPVLAWIEYIVANFDVKDKVLRKESQNFLIETLIEICRQMGKKYIYTNVKHESLINTLRNCGFIVDNGRSTTEMIKII